MTRRVVIFGRDALISTVQKAYELSAPQGMGFIHFRPEPMEHGDAARIIESQGGPSGLHLDYVAGRAVKLSIRRYGPTWYLEDNGTWYDHSEYQWEQLIAHVRSFDPYKREAN